ncbi:DUF4294 domain-containing protein [Pedobacter yulinensis]|uniref:DUF4294 domain-containing protein n=1 Tax=Pedobacter yulinensis TaxID=2126353 RepID=A0A2T3HIE2_9SPHI|nr:DUF4294 domain-containing protein [Pedobacter yulinensis]PST82209.1 DUF4294 domain-containing protein [Pedobacter yulinensis]
MKFLRFFLPLCVMIWAAAAFSAKAQVDPASLPRPITGKNDTIRVALTQYDGEMIPWIALSEVRIYGQRTFASEAHRLAFNRLRYNVLKVMPYALYAKRRYGQLEYDLAKTKDRREQRKLVKACDKEIKDMFNREIKELTITQGQILTKLIDREVGRTTFDIVKQTKGGFSAFVYQSVARVVGHNLKSKYDPREDREIESIIISSGYYNY